MRVLALSVFISVTLSFGFFQAQASCSLKEDQLVDFPGFDFNLVDAQKLFSFLQERGLCPGEFQSFEWDEGNLENKISTVDLRVWKSDGTYAMGWCMKRVTHRDCPRGCGRSWNHYSCHRFF